MRCDQRLRGDRIGVRAAFCGRRAVEDGRAPPPPLQEPLGCCGDRQELTCTEYDLSTFTLTVSLTAEEINHSDRILSILVLVAPEEHVEVP